MLPIVASLIASGLGTLAQAVVNKGQDYVEDKLGVKIGPLLGSEEGTYKLAQLELDKQELLLGIALEDRKVDMELYKLEVADRSSARTANAAIATSENSGWLNKNLLPMLSIGTLGTCLYGLIWAGPSVDTDAKYALISIITMILGYYYGSSSLAWKQQGSIGRTMESKE